VDLESLLTSARAQGPVFWAATAAIALGLTLLLVALLHRAWRAARGRTSGATVAPAQAMATATEPADDPAASVAAAIAAATDAYAGAGAPPAAAGPAPLSSPDDELADQSLALLLRRLQAAGDRLEQIAGDLQDTAGPARDSLLKDAADEVEYVFKACGP
jgi:hypothetical protein